MRNPSWRFAAHAVVLASTMAAATAIGASPALAAADVGIAFTSAPASITTDDVASYTFTVTNGGPSEAFIEVDVALDGPFGEVTAPDCFVEPSNVFCPMTLPAGASATRTYTVSPSAPGQLVNRAWARTKAGTSDPNPTNDQATVTTVVTAPSADLGVSLSASAGLLASQIAYDLGVSNAGPGDATSSTVEVALPAATSSVSGLPGGCTYAASTDTVTCATGAVVNGTSATRSFRANLGLLSVGPLTATATRTSSTPSDPNGANDSASASCTAVTSLVVLC